MDKEVMDKLMEIKKLYDAGVLTKEEMEAEKAKILRPISSVTSESKKEMVASNDKPQPRTSKGTLKQGLSKDTKIWLIAGSVVAVMLIIAIIIQNGRSSNSQTYDNDYAVADTDTVMVDDTDYDTAVDDSQEQTPQSYADKAEDYIGGLDTDTRVVASLTDDERHCVYTLTEVELGWGRVNSLYCHNLETGSTNIVNVPYKVEGEEEAGEQVADARMVGNNLYVVNTSYRCGQSVACLNTRTGKWSCVVRACVSADFISNNRLKVSYAELVYEGECLADNQYEYTDKVITLK
ncbi:SHOCT domain-containing protein [Leyella stercorea]|uniref:SHOCT domain-containing protein n=1 Tax=Leyella stercorea TaxID=363265 RepID=UPI0035201423